MSLGDALHERETEPERTLRRPVTGLDEGLEEDAGVPIGEPGSAIFREDSNCAIGARDREPRQTTAVFLRVPQQIRERPEQEPFVPVDPAEPLDDEP